MEREERPGTPGGEDAPVVAICRRTRGSTAGWERWAAQGEPGTRGRERRHSGEPFAASNRAGSRSSRRSAVLVEVRATVVDNR